MMTTPSPSAPWMQPEIVFEVADEAALAKVAKLIARYCVVGDLIRLVGDLGAGKSTFARYMIQALGHEGEVPSPTYTLVQTYDDTRLPVAHVDCYRMKSPSELEELGLEVFRSGGLLIAEWPDLGGALLASGQPDLLPYHINNPDNGGTLEIRLEAGDTPMSRKVTLLGSTSWQHRYGLFAAGSLPVATARAVTEENRKAFLDGIGLTDYSIAGLAPEWSFRSYWRVTQNDGVTWILMDSPPPFEGVNQFARVADYYREIGLNTAKNIAKDDKQGYLLSEDLGSVRLLDLMQQGKDVTPWYEVACDVLVTACKAEAPSWGRVYLPRDWWVEMARFTDWYMPLVRGKQTSPEERKAFAALWAPLFSKVKAIPMGLLPWDYQATNMMICGDEPTVKNMGLVDIQDARVAPICQDLAILLRDIRRDRDDALEERIVTRAANALGVDLVQMREAVDICNLQHCVRILGGLGRSAYRDNAWGGWKNFMPRTWEVARQSYDNPVLKDIVDVLKPLEELGLAKQMKVA